jgi:phosphoserine aminotransferase
MSTNLHVPLQRPANPNFSSGPCAKRPGWTSDVLKSAVVGRSHRSKPGLAKLREVIELTRAVLGIPADHRIAIVPGSDTGAMEMTLWSLLGSRGVDVAAWENFGQGWVVDLTTQMKLDDCRVFSAPYGALPDLSETDPDRDIVFTWNGTSSGVRVPDGDWISDTRAGLTICDATSAAFAMDLPWSKLDVTTWSWQKVLGGEGAHGMLVLGPRAIERLESYDPPWPLPKLFRMKNGGRINNALFEGSTINTPSLLAVEDAIDGLRWAQAIGGLPVLKRRCQANFDCAAEWVQRSRWCDFLGERPEIRSQTSICLKIVDPPIASDVALQAKVAVAVVEFLAKEGIAFDVGAYRTAPPGFRLWSGATVETSDLAAALEWLSFAYGQVKGRTLS